VSGFLVPSFISESQWKLPDADPDTDTEEEKKRVASTGAEVGRSDGGYAGGPVDGPGLKVPSSEFTERSTTEGIVVEVDISNLFLILLHDVCH